MPTLTEMLLIDALVLLLFVSMWYFVSLAIKRQDIADTLWGAGFVLVVFTSLAVVELVSLRGLVMSFLVIVWGSRLGVRIYLRNRARGEDFRYNRWRKEWGRYFALRSFFQVFFLQGVLMLVVLAPVLYVVGSGQPVALNFLDLVGGAVWLSGFIIESVADYQLDRFKSRAYNQGAILQSGLWRYSRHPNYFGEVVMWWGIYLMTLSVEGGWLTFFGPLVITLLILKVSGIPLLEEHYRDNPGYQRYAERTSVFIPMPPRSIKE